MHAAETLLGPVVGATDLSQDERDVIGLYIQQITEKFPNQQIWADTPAFVIWSHAGHERICRDHNDAGQP